MSITFNPSIGFKNGHLQSFMVGFVLRKLILKNKSKQLKSKLVEFSTSDGVLLGELSTHSKPLGNVTIIHGWEGSSKSNYVLSQATWLYKRGFNVLRLNLRDHGDSHHLNDEFFHAWRIADVMESLSQFHDEHPGMPNFLIGFSLGGNFAIRATALSSEYGVSLDASYAISPAVSPKDAMYSIDELAPYKRYFIKKWKRSLRKKQQAFPDKYGQLDIDSHNTILGLSEYFAAEKLLPGDNLAHYLDGYAITQETLDKLPSPLTVITAMDDPVIAFSSFEKIAQHPKVESHMLAYGGHCGFFSNLSLKSVLDPWIGRQMVKLSTTYKTNKP